MSSQQQNNAPKTFMKGGELYLKTDKEIRESINGLELSARNLLIQMNELRMEDLFFMSVIDKSLKLIDPFLNAYRNKNIYVLSVLTRLQIDCVTRTYAMTLVENSTDYCRSVLVDNVEVHKMKDKNNQKLNDRYMCEELGKYLGLPVYQLYQKTSQFIHFSSVSFNLMAKAEKENSMSLLVGKKNRPDQHKEFKRLSKELANQFFFFGYILQNDLLQSWFNQLETESSVKQ